MNKERRRYFRINDRIQVRIHAIDKDSIAHKMQQLHALKDEPVEHIQSLEKLHHCADRLDHIRAQQPELADVLDCLEAEIESITECCQKNREWFSQQTSAVNLSAQGLSLETDYALPAGSWVELQLKLRAYAPPLLILAQVVRCTPSRHAQDHYHLGFNFEHLLESTRQQLVRHIQERQIQRQSKHHTASEADESR